MKLLFICSRNKWRSRTAEVIFRDHPHFTVRSAGTSPKAQRKVSQSDLDWADRVLVMESKHRRILKQEFDLDGKDVMVLDIPDEYQFMDEELVELLRGAVETL